MKIPTPDRPYLPEGYDVPNHTHGLLPWSYIVERMEASLNYWVATVAPDGSPHVTPVWGVWVDDTFYFDGSPETRRGKNITQNPKVVVHLEDGSKVVILHGAALFQPPDREVAEKLSAQYTAKYASDGYAPTPDQWVGGIYIVKPRLVLAWTKFPGDMTRWQF